jgi:hypothetical protein
LGILKKKEREKTTEESSNICQWQESILVGTSVSTFV